jgi:uncharacterized protein Smg (DUF494 family)
MKDRVVELLVLLMSEIRADKQLAEIDMNDLQDRGFSASEISQALSWLQEHLPQGAETTTVAPRTQGSRRILHDAEKGVLTTQGQGYLIQLVELGLLGERELETVIERAMLTGYERLTLEELREIVAGVLSAREQGPHRTFLNNEDTIH